MPPDARDERIWQVVSVNLPDLIDRLRPLVPPRP